jgi:hypothetical protein
VREKEGRGMSSQTKQVQPISGKVSEAQREQAEKLVMEDKLAREVIREVSAEDLLKAEQVKEVPDPLKGLQEGRVVHYLTPNDWRPNARGQVRAGLIVFCYRDALGKPTGTVNLALFLNGPVDTGDMGGAKTRCLEFLPGVKFSDGKDKEPGTWSWPGRS